MKLLTNALLLLATSSCTSTAPGSADVLDTASADRSYYVYVTAESADAVALTRFDAATGTCEIVQRIPVGYQPTEIEGPHGLTVAPDGKHWFLTMAHGKPFGLLYKYETGTNKLVGECELGLFPATMQISRATGLLYCVNFDLHGKMGPSSVSVVDPDAMIEVARTTTGPMPHGSRITPDGLLHYSCAMMSDQLFEIDAASFEIKRTLHLSIEDGAVEGDGHGEHAAMDHEAMGDGALAMKHAKPKAKPTWVFPHPTRDFVYVALNGAAQVVEVDTKSWQIVRRFPTDKGPYNVEISPDGARMVITYKSAQGIGVWDLAKGVELARIPSSRRITHGVVISPDSRYAFVSSEGIGAELGTLDVVDLATNEITATVEIGLQTGGIAFWKMD